MTEVIKAKRAIVQIVECEVVVDGFQDSEGNYYMSQSDVGRSIGRDEKVVRTFLKQKQSEDLSSKNSRLGQSIKIDNDSKGRQFNAVTLDVVHEFWSMQALKGNKRAIALICALSRETLQRRYDNSFAVQRTEQEYEQQTAEVYDSIWDEIREWSKGMPHKMFGLACKAYYFDPARTHDLITLKILGKTARELKKEKLIGKNPNIGLDHIEQAEKIKQVAEVKIKFSGMLTGTCQERVERAVKAVCGK